MADPQRVNAAMGEWLTRYEWDAWMTLTFRAGEFTPEAASRAAAGFLEWIRAQGSPRVSYFLAHEVGGHGGRLHLHGLIGALAPYTQRAALWSWWYKRYGRAQILTYQPQRGAAYYVAKYVTKEISEWDLDLTGFAATDPQTDFLTRVKRCSDGSGRPIRPRKRTPPSGGSTAATRDSMTTPPRGTPT